MRAVLYRPAGIGVNINNSFRSIGNADFHFERIARINRRVRMCNRRCCNTKEESAGTKPINYFSKTNMHLGILCAVPLRVCIKQRGLAPPVVYSKLFALDNVLSHLLF
jgi:hypothetical protein